MPTSSKLVDYFNRHSIETGANVNLRAVHQINQSKLGVIQRSVKTSPWLNDILDGPMRHWTLLSRPNRIDDTFSFVGHKKVKRVRHTVVPAVTLQL